MLIDALVTDKSVPILRQTAAVLIGTPLFLRQLFFDQFRQIRRHFARNFGPKAPDGLESNWIPTEGLEPYVWLRLYGLEEAFWTKSFKMPDVELMQ
jgi:hypothetical protein